MNRKENGQHVWKNYFSMLSKAGIPYVLLAVCFGFSMLVAVMSLQMASQISVVLQEYPNINDVVPQIWKLVAIILLGVFSSVAGAHLKGIATAQIDRNMQRYAVRNVYYLKTADLEAQDTREFITRLTDDTAKNSPFLLEIAVNEIPRIYYLIAAIFAVSALGQPLLTGAMFLLIPSIVILSYVSGRITFKNRNKIQNRLATVTAGLAEKIDNIEVIKSYGTEGKEIKNGEAILDEYQKVKKEGVLVDHINQYIKNILWFIDIAIMVIPPTLLMVRGVIDRGGYVAFILIIARFETYLREHLLVWLSLKEAQGATLRLSSVLNLENEKEVVSKAELVPGDLEFKDVTFAYGDHVVLRNVSFTIPRGSKTGIVGLSGSGKSTVLNLIEKFYIPASGSITLGGTDIQQFDYNHYRDLFAYLPQNAPGISGSVRDMLCYGAKKQYSDEQLDQVLEDVLLKEDIKELGGLEYQIGHNGENLSGGQRQKLGIARMLLSDCPYVLLDEATSALDPESTLKIQKVIDEKCADKTLIVVAHDLSTIRNADQILVFDQGHLAGKGTHEQLKESLPLYRELVREVK